MKNIKEAKKNYDNIEIPAELKDIVEKEFKPKSRYMYIPKLVAGVLVFFVVGVNVSETFASAFSNIPFIGKIVSVISIHKEKIDSDKIINTYTPEILADKENIKEVADKINKQIQDIVDEYTKEAEKHIAEYKEAFIATGGTEEEFKQKNIKVDVSYDIKSENENYLSFVLNANENWVNAYNVSYFYNINLNTGAHITLKDILGDNYIEIANKSIKEQIEKQILEDENASYFGYNVKSINGFETITDSTKFYINDKGNPVIVFDKYEIAPGSMGQVEFEIPKNK